MADMTIAPTQRTAARIVGALYILTNVTAIIAFSIRGGLLVARNPAATLANIAGSQSLFRLGIAIELVTVAGVLALVAALYVVLAPINRPAAMVATFWRLVENIVLAVTPLNAFALALLASGPQAGLDPAPSQSLASLFFGLYGAGYQFGFAFLGLGSTLFSYLWLKSRYIPAAIAWWGIFASLVMALGSFALIVQPRLGAIIGLAYMGPMGIYEFGLGLWLLLRPLRPAA
jgi:hypothetical protein